MHLSKIVKFEKCTKCQIGDWGFPQSVKSQKPTCGISANRLYDLFIFACVRTLAMLARVKVALTQRGSERLHFAKNNQKTFSHFAKTIKRQFY